MLNLTKSDNVINRILVRALDYALRNNDNLDSTEKEILGSVIKGNLVALNTIEELAQALVKIYPDQKIKAIKSLREKTGMSLLDAKNLIDKFR